ncbi:MAG TPA: hypothetical protein PKD23_10885 [Bellilinea sp.]|nr:hypothetical protein [Bellilinea sp.]
MSRDAIPLTGYTQWSFCVSICAAVGSLQWHLHIGQYRGLKDCCKNLSIGQNGFPYHLLLFCISRKVLFWRFYSDRFFTGKSANQRPGNWLGVKLEIYPQKDKSPCFWVTVTLPMSLARNGVIVSAF